MNGKSQTTQRGIQSHTGVTRVRFRVTTRTRLFDLIGLHDGVAGLIGPHVQLGTIDVERGVDRSAVRRDLARRRRHHAATVGVDEVSRHPRSVGDAIGVEFAGRHERLLHLTVDRVAIDVEVVDGVEGEESFVEEEAVAHLGNVEQTSVGQHIGVL